MATQPSGRPGEKEKILLTPEGYAEKQARYEFLVNERRPAVADYIHDAKEAGDISESSAYEDAKNAQAMLEGEIQELRRILENAVILEAPTETDGQRTVRIGATVEIETSTGTRRSFMIVSTVEANATAGKVSDQSPVGRALLGHGVGDSVEVTTPMGLVTYTIRAIR